MMPVEARTRSEQKNDAALIAKVVRASIDPVSMGHPPPYDDTPERSDSRRTPLRLSPPSVINMTNPEAVAATEGPGVNKDRATWERMYRSRKSTHEWHTAENDKQNAELKSNLDSCKRDLVTKEKDFDALLTEYDELESGFDACKGKLEARDGKLDKLGKELTALQELYRKLMARSVQREENKAKEIARLGEALAASLADCKAIAQTRELLIVAYTDAASDIATLKQEKEDMTAAFDHAAYENDRLTRENDELHVDNTKLKNAELRKAPYAWKRVDKLRKENALLQTQVQRRGLNLQAKQREIAALGREVREHKGRVDRQNDYLVTQVMPRLAQVEKNQTHKRRRLQ
jgi:chromosome segregation ATPase